MKSGHKNVSGSHSGYLFTSQAPEILCWTLTCYKLYIRVGIPVLRWTVIYSFERRKNEGRMKEVVLVPLLKSFIHLKLQDIYRLNLVPDLYMWLCLKHFFIKVKLIFHLKFKQKITRNVKYSFCRDAKLCLKSPFNKILRK